MVRSPWWRSLREPALESAILGVLGGVLPLPVILVIVPAILLLALRDLWLRRSGAALAGVLAGGGMLALAAAIPLKPLDARLALAPNPTTGEVMDALEATDRLAVKDHVRVDRSRRVDLPARPTARDAVDALRAATGCDVRARTTCLSGASVLLGADGQVIRILPAR